LAQLIKHDKKFLIVGHQNAITYKEVFPLIKENKVWLGMGNLREFAIPSYYPLTSKSYRVEEDGTRIIKANGVKWFTNLSHSRRNEELILTKKYTSDEFPYYDNYDAIEVSKVKAIPKNWGGVYGCSYYFPR
ncbi:MAG: restriction endonuclease subunit M, partial [Flavobacteriaceae bacterium]|nr:restriction endonuclease subunit M [Flavobacteriaceae bacterium]